MSLQQIGADARVRELFLQHGSEDLELGRVSFAAHEQYRIYFETGECDAAPAGRLRWSSALPAVGDWVAARRVDPAFALIESVLPRRTQFSRRAPSNAVTEQVLAANIDLAVIVCGLDRDFNLRRLERYLVLARESGAEHAIVLNKADLCDALDERIRQVNAIASGSRVLAIHALVDIEPVRDIARNRTVVFLGSSGAGKSTIVNGLLGESRQSTTEVRESDSRGRHTTTSRMLIPLPGGGAVIDSPGMRELQLWAGEESLDEVFSDIAALAALCRFADCTHSGEPACAVRAALDNGEIDLPRWSSYCKLQKELQHELVQRDARAAADRKREWKILHKAMRDHPKYRR